MTPSNPEINNKTHNEHKIAPRVAKAIREERQYQLMFRIDSLRCGQNVPVLSEKRSEQDHRKYK